MSVKALSWTRKFSPSEGPYRGIQRVHRDALITDSKGRTIFLQKGIETPDFWSDLALSVVAQKYFRGAIDKKTGEIKEGRETSVFEIVNRVADTIAGWAGYVIGDKDPVTSGWSLFEVGEEDTTGTEVVRGAGDPWPGMQEDPPIHRTLRFVTHKRPKNTMQSPGDVYFADKASWEAWRDDLKWLLIHQYGCFNSPVWFNVGWDEHPQASACLPGHALVNTTEGFIPISRIVEENRIGLTVHDGEGITQVVGVKENGRKIVYRVELNDGFYVEATGDHLVCAHETRRTATEEWRKVEDLEPGMYMRVYPHMARTYSPASESIDISEAILAGWVQADGFVGTPESKDYLTSHVIEWMTVNQEEENFVLDRIQRVFLKKPHTTSVPSEDPNLQVKRHRLNGAILAPFIEKYGLHLRSTDIRVPHQIWTAGNDVVSAYLKAVFQSDGCATKRSIQLASVSLDWVREIQILLTRLGIYSRRRTWDMRERDRKDLSVLDISIHSEKARFSKNVGFVSQKKIERTEKMVEAGGKTCPNVRFQQIRSIEPLGEMQVYDIQTLSGKFLTNSVLVHNCFILRMNDWFSQQDSPDFDLEADGIIAAQVKEALIFAKGSGSGLNLSRVRSSKEWLSRGGHPTGPMSYAKGLDTWATSIKSGGTTRRAAKMLVMDVDHPDVREFIHVKATEEKVAKTLIAAGYPKDMDGEAYQHAFHQNSNLSVRVSDEFMKQAESRGLWKLVSRTNYFLEKKPEANTMLLTKGRIIEQVPAYDLFREMAQQCWESGDPGMQFADTINHWHTCSDEEPIFASNPCSEYFFLDETSCNLASLNLARFLYKESIQAEALMFASEVFTIAMEAIVSNAKYPTPKIARTTDRYRTLGLGFANLGGLLMRMRIPYDSGKGRALASGLQSVICSSAYAMSARIAEFMGPFAGFEANKQSCLRVMHEHQAKARMMIEEPGAADWIGINRLALDTWKIATAGCMTTGLRNAQATVIAPTGTIAIMMDCETTGIEPELSLVKYKTLAGGGQLMMANPLAEGIIREWIRDEGLADQAVEHVAQGKSIRTFKGINPQNGFVELLRTSFAPEDDPEFSLSWRAHVDMMAAVQPFVSGGISKTVNMPESSTVGDIERAYMYAWTAGLKSIAIYRDNSKHTQPMTTKSVPVDDILDKATKDLTTEITNRVIDVIKSTPPGRRSLASEVVSARYKFRIEGHKGYLHIGFYPDTWEVGEIFVKLSKQGSAVNGLVDGFCILFSMAIQYGVPLEDVVEKFVNADFEPRGLVQDDRHIRSCRSVLDFIVRKVWALSDEAKAKKGLPVGGPTEAPKVLTQEQKIDAAQKGRYSGKACDRCGSINVKMAGNCLICMSCGSESGGCYA